MANLHLITGMGDDIRNCITKEKTELQKIERYSRCLSLDTAIETIKWRQISFYLKESILLASLRMNSIFFVVHRIKKAR